MKAGASPLTEGLQTLFFVSPHKLKYNIQKWSCQLLYYLFLHLKRQGDNERALPLGLSPPAQRLQQRGWARVKPGAGNFTHISYIRGTSPATDT